MNTVINIKESKGITTGVCVFGPLRGKRVVRISSGWIPAGEATPEEMGMPSSGVPTWLENIVEQSRKVDAARQWKRYGA